MKREFSSHYKKAEENLLLAFEKKAQVALGSDAGAYSVLHGKGLLDEYQAFCRILGNSSLVKEWLYQGEERIRGKFRRPQS